MGNLVFTLNSFKFYFFKRHNCFKFIFFKTYLFKVSAPDQLAPKIEILSFRLLEIRADLVVRVLQVTLVRVEDDRLVLVVLPHELQRNTRNRRLEVRLLSVHHQAHVHVLSRLHQRVQSSNHVPEHLLLLRGQLRDEPHHAAGLQIRNTKSVAQFLVLVDDAGPREQVEDAARKNSLEECLCFVTLRG